MTRRQLIVLGIVGAVLAAALGMAHLALPLSASWSANRMLQYAWLAAVVLALAGGTTWLMWPRHSRSRRDIAREEARRKVFGLVGLFGVTILLVVYGEMHRDLATRAFLKDVAGPSLTVLGDALARHTAAHGGDWPTSLDVLVEEGLLKPETLQYAYRGGPVAAEPKAGTTPDTGSFALARQFPGVHSRGTSDTRYAVYLRPGNAWAGLTAVIDKDGTIEVVADDAVQPFEWQFQQKP
jgi:hypothetical protein